MRRGGCGRGRGRGGVECAHHPSCLPCPPPGRALALSLLCLLLRGPRGLIWSQGTGQPGSKGRREIQRGGGGTLPARAPGKGGCLSPYPHSQGLSFHQPQPREGRLRHQRKASRHLLSCLWFLEVSGPGQAGGGHTALLRAAQEPTGLRRRCCSPLSRLCAQATPAWHTQPARRGETSREPPPHCSTAWGAESSLG